MTPRFAALALTASACGGTAPSTSTINNTVDPTTHGAPEIDTSKLAEDAKQTFDKLSESLKSPCGKAHSLRTSYLTDHACKRGPYAARYVIALLEDEVTEDRIIEQYTSKYDSTAAPIKLDVSRAPHIGDPGAPVRLVEFFDYGCPHCAQMRPVLEKVAAEHAGQVVEYFMMFPLGNPVWPHSKSAAQAALAAGAQQKFPQMHALLFEKAPAHNEAEVTAYAQQLGLDVTTFAADYKAAVTQVESDRAQGDAAGIQATPTLFFNDRKYEGPYHPRYLGMWIDEEIAVNR
jgi:protein-disulfide isomerase